MAELTAFSAISSRSFIVALTGGIGAGKSTVANIFAQLGVPIIDADMISRSLTARGTPLLEKIVAHLGPAILTAQGELNRAYLRNYILQYPHEKQWLEQLLHPAIFAELQARIVQQQAPYIIIVVPLLFEVGWQSLADRILVVDLPPQLQVARTIMRDKISSEQILALMAHQCSREQRLAGAHDVLRNTADLATLTAQVHQLHAQYLMYKK